MNKKINIVILINFILLVICFSLFISGSLEMFPTEEQQGKFRIVIGIIFTLLLLLEGTLIIIRKSLSKKS